MVFLFDDKSKSIIVGDNVIGAVSRFHDRNYSIKLLTTGDDGYLLDFENANLRNTYMDKISEYLNSKYVKMDNEVNVAICESRYEFIFVTKYITAVFNNLVFGELSIETNNYTLSSVELENRSMFDYNVLKYHELMED